LKHISYKLDIKTQHSKNNDKHTIWRRPSKALVMTLRVLMVKLVISLHEIKIIAKAIFGLNFCGDFVVIFVKKRKIPKSDF